MKLRDWDCPVCKQPNGAGESRCINCDCSSNVSVAEIVELRASYKGPILASPLDELPYKPPNPALFSDAWWKEELGLLGVSLAIFPIAAIAGAIAVIGGGLMTGRTIRLEEPLYGALILGAFMSVRNLFRPFGIGPKYGTRRNIVLWFAGIFTAMLIFVFYALARQQP